MLVFVAIYGIWCGCNILFALHHIQGLINNINMNFIVTMFITIIEQITITIIYILAFITVLTCSKLWIWFKLFLLLRLIVDVKFSCSRRVAKLLSQNCEKNHHHHPHHHPPHHHHHHHHDSDQNSRCFCVVTLQYLVEASGDWSPDITRNFF